MYAKYMIHMQLYYIHTRKRTLMWDIRAELIICSWAGFGLFGGSPPQKKRVWVLIQTRHLFAIENASTVAWLLNGDLTRISP
jgi:hypothetical protein